MIKLAKYLKPFALIFALTVALLFLQAMCDLNLPKYMSRIVNVGIQQSGVESSAPKAISEKAMAFITSFMREDQIQSTFDVYKLQNSTDLSTSGKAYKDTYPSAGEKLYIKSDLAEADELRIAKNFKDASATLVNLFQSTDDSLSSGKPGKMSAKDLDMATLYRVQPLLESLPPESIEAARESALSDTSMLSEQSGVLFAQMYYRELGTDLGAMQTAYILRIGGFMLAIALLSGAATVCVSLLSSRIAAGVARDLRADTFGKIEQFSSAEFDKFSTASLITRCTNDIMQIQMLLMVGIRLLCFSPIMAIGGITMAIQSSVSMTWIIAIAVIALVGVIMIIMSVAMPRFKIVQKLIDRLNLVSRENLSGLMVIRAFGAQQHEKKRFEAANSNLTKTNLFINRIMTSMFPSITLIMSGSTLAIVWVGAHQIAASSMQIGDMMAFMQYAMQIIMSFMMISMMFIFIPRAAVSADRIAEVLETEIKLRDPEQPKSFISARKGYVEFNHVHFRYENAQEDALCDISFTAKPGQTTAIIGPTGSGKSTIANLIMRFYDVSEGRILVDGADVREVKQSDLRNKIGYIPQKGILLSGTIASNLKYGKKNATDEEIKTAAEIAQAMEFIEEKPDGFESEIAQGGTNVSGGQKQRLSIARALAKQPEIFIFDDSFSALDFKTDAQLRRALKSHTGNSTVIVVAQRVNTIMNAEQIIVLDEGKIVGHGTHRELLRNCPQYYEIASTQLSKEELA